MLGVSDAARAAALDRVGALQLPPRGAHRRLQNDPHPLAVAGLASLANVGTPFRPRPLTAPRPYQGSASHCPQLPPEPACGPFKPGTPARQFLAPFALGRPLPRFKLRFPASWVFGPMDERGLGDVPLADPDALDDAHRAQAVGPFLVLRPRGVLFDGRAFPPLLPDFAMN